MCCTAVKRAVLCSAVIRRQKAGFAKEPFRFHAVPSPDSTIPFKWKRNNYFGALKVIVQKHEGLPIPYMWLLSMLQDTQNYKGTQWNYMPELTHNLFHVITALYSLYKAQIDYSRGHWLLWRLDTLFGNRVFATDIRLKATHHGQTN